MMLKYDLVLYRFFQSGSIWPQVSPSSAIFLFILFYFGIYGYYFIYLYLNSDLFIMSGYKGIVIDMKVKCN